MRTFIADPAQLLTGFVEFALSKMNQRSPLRVLSLMNTMNGRARILCCASRGLIISKLPRN